MDFGTNQSQQTVCRFSSRPWRKTFGRAAHKNAVQISNRKL